MLHSGADGRRSYPGRVLSNRGLSARPFPVDQRTPQPGVSAVRAGAAISEARRTFRTVAGSGAAAFRSRFEHRRGRGAGYWRPDHRSRSGASAGSAVYLHGARRGRPNDSASRLLGGGWRNGRGHRRRGYHGRQLARGCGSIGWFGRARARRGIDYRSQRGGGGSGSAARRAEDDAGDRLRTRAMPLVRAKALRW